MNILSISAKSLWHFGREYIESADQFGGIVMLSMLLSLLIHEHGMSVCCLVFICTFLSLILENIKEKNHMREKAISISPTRGEF